jgi:hypothetical protein
MPEWQLVVADRLGNPIGELSTKAYDRSVRIPLNGPRSCSFRTRIDNRLNAQLLEPALTRVAAYRDGTLQFVGPVVTFEEIGAGEDSGIAFVAMDAAWRIDKLRFGKSTAGYKQGTALAPVSLATIVDAIMTDAGAYGAQFGISAGAMSTSASTYVGPWHYKSPLEAMQELSETLDGFDWRIQPSNVVGDPVIGELQIADYFGIDQPNAIWEYGAGRHNASGYARAGSADGLLNSGYSLPAGFPDATPEENAGSIMTVTDPDAIAAYGTYEDVVDSDLVVDALREQLLREHVRIRKAPRQTIVFQPTVRDGLDFGTDYDVGDVVGFRATQNDEKRIDVRQRIFAIEFAIDDAGNENKSLTVAAS